MLSQTAEYALRAVVFLAETSPALRTNQQIADGTQVPSSYLSKVLQGLQRAGVVLTLRGKGGGSRLTRDAADITALEVVNAVDPVRRIDSCPLGLPRHAGQLCPLHRKLDDALATLEASLASTPMREMLDNDGGDSLCQIAGVDP
ncbi:MAG: Rrf2 family transcriptional regulator [Gemmatimonadetes bacterium]|jgi:Rrf2 family transcriptional regulator, nitric oxide-sensitive transcriptional repressor|nr:Rrf2 family transcriptional regulator [Gemmatimonadota bacterium]MBT7860988.1 Rrf2 family transcriptional regulator [Gemmatimonadota bacterium]